MQKGTSKKPSIQEIIEKALHNLTQERIKIVSSGRTDAGVHAKAQVANFKTSSKISTNRLLIALNGNLPDDICITEVTEVPQEFHSRFSAKSKIYRYSILNRKYPSAFLRNQAFFYQFPLDIKLMLQEAKSLVGTHNFASFKASEKKDKDAVRTIKQIVIHKSNDLIFIDIEADGFLYNMARNIAGTLIDIGRGRIKKGDLKKILHSHNRRNAGTTAPAKGLCLIKVKY